MLLPAVKWIQTFLGRLSLVFQVHVLVQLALADLLAAATLMAATLLSKYDDEGSLKFCLFGLPLALVSLLQFFPPQMYLKLSEL